MNRDTFREQLLGVMERKEHWAWSAFTSGRVPRERLHFHFEQEYGTYVRDFPILVGRSYIRCPIAEIRRALAENLYEEETGGLVAGRPHPELFLEYPRGLGMDMSRFENIQLLPAAQRYREFLDAATNPSAGISLRRSSPSLSKEPAPSAQRSMGPTANRRRWRNIHW